VPDLHDQLRLAMHVRKTFDRVAQSRDAPRMQSICRRPGLGF
jgi:hypothetical protein